MPLLFRILPNRAEAFPATIHSGWHGFRHEFAPAAEVGARWFFPDDHKIHFSLASALHRGDQYRPEVRGASGAFDRVGRTAQGYDRQRRLG